MTVALGDHYSNFTQSMNSVPTLNFSIAEKRKGHSTLSIAFNESRGTTSPHTSLSLANCIMFRSLLMLLEELLPLIKPVWSGFADTVISGSSLKVKTLDKIFASTLMSDTGL